jgi:ClpP class serine protease
MLTLWASRYAELLADSRSFTEEEDHYFSEQAQYAYETFRDKAALSRGLPKEKLQKVAQVGIRTAVPHIHCVLVLLACTSNQNSA